MVKEYTTKILCGNCGGKNTINVPIGVTVDGHLRLKSELCTNCNCRIKCYHLQHKSL